MQMYNIFFILQIFQHFFLQYFKKNTIFQPNRGKIHRNTYNINIAKKNDSTNFEKKINGIAYKNNQSSNHQDDQILFAIKKRYEQPHRYEFPTPYQQL